MTWFTFNVITDEASYPLYFECDTRENAERMISEVGLTLDESGVSEMICAVPDRRSN